MGRELIVNRIDFVEGNKAIIRDYDDTYICGRTDFTNALSTLFYDRNVVYLIVDYDGKLDDSIKIDPVSWEDEDLSLEEFNNIDLKTVIDICNEHIKKDNMELEREHEMLDSARTARRNTNTVKDFSDFSDLIDELQKHINKYFKEAEIFKEYIYKVLKDISYEDMLDKEKNHIEKSFVLLILSE